MSHSTSLTSLDLLGAINVDDRVIIEIANSCPFLTALRLPSRTTSIFTLHSVEHGICRMRHLTTLHLSGVRHSIHSREMLARMIVSSLPLLLHLDLSVDATIATTEQSSADSLHTVTLPEKCEIHSQLLDILGGKFAVGLSFLSLNGRRFLDPIGKFFFEVDSPCC